MSHREPATDTNMNGEMRSRDHFLSLRWKLASKARHYFDSQVPLERCERSSIPGTTRIGPLPVCPYSAIDLSREGPGTELRGSITLYQDEDNHIDVACVGAAMTVTVTKNGSDVSRSRFMAASARATGIRVHLNGRCLAVHMIGDGSTIPGKGYCGCVGIGDHFDLRDDKVRSRFSIFGSLETDPGATCALRTYLTCGTGQADPRAIRYEDGTTMSDGSRIWLAMTTRGYDHVEDSCQGVYELDMDSLRLRLVSIIGFEPQKSELIDGLDCHGTQRQWHAAAILYDRSCGQWRFSVTSHGDDHALWQGTLPRDPRQPGYLTAQARRMRYPASGNDEDSYAEYDPRTGAWTLVYVRWHRALGRYETYMAESSEWDGSYSCVAGPGDAQTGPMMQTFADGRIVLAGRGSDSGFVALDPDDGMRVIGHLELDVSPTGRSVWPVFVELPTGSRLISFSRDPADGQTPTGRYSYGDMLVYGCR